MIVYLRGTLAEKSPSRAVIEAAGVGYAAEIPLSTYDRLPATGAEVKLLTVHCVREDDEALYGFATEPERNLFSLLTTVQGVGPRIALAILSGGSAGEISLAITGGNHKRIAAVKGVGRKTAEKICLELKDKVNAVEALAARSPAAASGAADARLRDALLALEQLGFAAETANRMVSAAIAAGCTDGDAQTLVRAALAARSV